MEAFLRQMTRDITTHYQLGERYLTVQEIGKKFNVSLQTAQRGVKELSAKNMIRSVPKSGITVTSFKETYPVANKKVLILSGVPDTRINLAIKKGVELVTGPVDIQVDTLVNPGLNARCLDFGNYILDQDADGIISISFFNSYLAFYHAMINGMDMVADYEMEELPILPTVQTDNFRHGRQAGQSFAKQQFTEVLVIDGIPLESDFLRGIMRHRYQGVCSGFRKKEAVLHANHSSPEGMALIDQYFRDYTSDKAVFSNSFGSNWLAASKFIQYRVPVKNNNFMVYDAYEGQYEHQGLPPIPGVAPSIMDIGTALANKLVNKWKTGKFAEPLAEKI
jgi:DNA-binding transcriptional regulator YhcF (GntR family)